MPFVEGQDGWVEVSESVFLAGDGEELSNGAFVGEAFADAVLRLFLYFD